jgi:hypothetical protein
MSGETEQNSNQKLKLSEAVFRSLQCQKGEFLKESKRKSMLFLDQVNQQQKN